LANHSITVYLDVNSTESLTEEISNLMNGIKIFFLSYIFANLGTRISYNFNPFETFAETNSAGIN
jgi:hypothetical protein